MCFNVESYGYKNFTTSLGDFTKEDILQDLDIDCKFKKSLCAFLDDDRNDVPNILFVELRRKLIDDDVVTEEDKSNSSLINYSNLNFSIHQNSICFTTRTNAEYIVMRSQSH